MTDPMRSIQYRNLADALVTVTDLGHPTGDQASGNHVAAECGGCLVEMAANSFTTFADGRKWAATHAANCAALPRAMSAGQVERETYGALAEAYAARAVSLLEGRAPNDNSTAGLAAQEDPLATASIYIGLADVYARLSGR